MNIALLQVASPDGESHEDRVARVTETVGLANAADVIVLPELWPTGFFNFARYRDEAETLHGATLDRLASAARSASAWLIGGSFVELASDGHLHNTTVAFTPSGELAATYRKIHLFGYESAEAQLLTPGQDVSVFDTDYGRVGMSTCYDLRFPEQYRILTDKGATMIFVSSAWPASRMEHWLLLNRTRALENLAFVFACNAAGSQDGVDLAGNSLVIDPWGEIIARGGPEETWIKAQIEPQRVSDLRAEFPALADRRL